MWAIWGSVGLGPCAKAVPLSMQMAATAALSRMIMGCSFGRRPERPPGVADIVNAHWMAGEPKGSRKSSAELAQFLRAPAGMAYLFRHTNLQNRQRVFSRVPGPVKRVRGRCAVLEFFRRNIHLRSCVAIMAAYAVALQMLLAAMAPMQAPVLGDESFVICHGNGDSPADDQGKVAPAMRHI